MNKLNHLERFNENWIAGDQPTIRKKPLKKIIIMQRIKSFEVFESMQDEIARETKNMSMDFKNETNLNESKLSFLQGKPISLIKTRHTVGKWNEENRKMDRIKTDEDFEGIIGEIGDYEGYYTPGFWVMNDNGKKKGFVLYDKKNDEFIEGESTFHYTYKGKTEKDERLLNLFKINFIDTDKMYDNKLSESEHIDEGKIFQRII